MNYDSGFICVIRHACEGFAAGPSLRIKYIGCRSKYTVRGIIKAECPVIPSFNEFAAISEELEHLEKRFYPYHFEYCQ